MDIIGKFGKSIPFLIMVINVYSQYFKAEAIFSGVERRGALVMLISDSEAGMISYKAAVSFFPHRDAEDFAVDAIAAEHNAHVQWDKPLF